METHRNRDHELEEALRESLRVKAERMKASGESSITGGAPGEEPIRRWRRGSVEVTQMPDDEHGIARISVGRLPRSDATYCVFRGSRRECAKAMRDALKALI